MNTTLARSDQDQEQFSVIEQVVISGDLAKLQPQQRVQYYNRVCESIGLNPFTQPFSYITLNGKLTLYAKKDATEQLRKLHGISITSLAGQFVDDLYIVTATAQSRDGRIDQATGAVNIGGLKGEAKANAIMKGETKAKRRVTLSMAGLGWMDESETESVPGAQRVYVDTSTGEIVPNHRQLTVQAEPPAQPAPQPAQSAQVAPDDILAAPDVIEAIKKFVGELRSHEAPAARKATPAQHEYAVSVIDGITGKDTHRQVFQAIFNRPVTKDQPLARGACDLIFKRLVFERTVKDADGKPVKDANGKNVKEQNPDFDQVKVEMIQDIHAWALAQAGQMTIDQAAANMVLDPATGAMVEADVDRLWA